MKARISGIKMKNLLETLREGMDKELEKIKEHNRRVEVHNQRIDARIEEAQNLKEDELVAGYKEKLELVVYSKFFMKRRKYTEAEIYKLCEHYRDSIAVCNAKAQIKISMQKEKIERKSYPNYEFIRNLECASELADEIVLNEAEINIVVKYTGGYAKFMRLHGTYICECSESKS